MIDNTKCECGHNNPVGTILCEYCGKPLEAEVAEKETIVKEMRYEGAARRSQRKEQTIFDQIWSFFSSVKVAVVLIVITLILAAIGTILPQEQFIPGPPEIYYQQEYGWFGKWFYQLGLSDMYSSWWFVTLLAMIGISLVVCSLDRVIPLYKALNKQSVEKSISFLQRQKIALTLPNDSEEKEKILGKLTDALKKHRYQVRTENQSLLAEKGRFSRWGPYINHIGLIVFLVGVLLRWLPGWNLEEYVWVREGETVKIPNTPYYVKNERANIEFYDPKQLPKQLKLNQPIVKQYETDAVLYKQDPKTGKLKEVTHHSILVNHPLVYEGLRLYQSDFRPMELDALQLAVVDKQTRKVVGTFTVHVRQISLKQVYPITPTLKARIDEYYPDFAIVNNRPATLSDEPNRPAFIFEITDTKTGKTERSWVISGMDFPNPKENRYDIALAGIQTVNNSGLLVRVEKSLPIYLAGGIISMIGLVLGFYWQHRRVWVRVEENEVYIGAHTNKNWFALKREVEKVMALAGYPVDVVVK
jgi:cytochrome c biogenesis protein